MANLDGKAVCRLSPKADMPSAKGVALYKHRLFFTVSNKMNTNNYTVAPKSKKWSFKK